MSNIEKVEKTVEVYIVDGKEFKTKDAAEAYVQERNKFLNYTYYTVYTHFDFSEARGYQRKQLIGIEGHPYGKDHPYYKISLLAAAMPKILNSQDNGVGSFYEQSYHETWKIAQQNIYETITELSNAISEHQRIGYGSITKPTQQVHFIAEDGSVESMNIEEISV